MLAAIMLAIRAVGWLWGREKEGVKGTDEFVIYGAPLTRELFRVSRSKARFDRFGSFLAKSRKRLIFNETIRDAFDMAIFRLYWTSGTIHLTGWIDS